MIFRRFCALCLFVAPPRCDVYPSSPTYSSRPAPCTVPQSDHPFAHTPAVQQRPSISVRPIEQLPRRAPPNGGEGGTACAPCHNSRSLDTARSPAASLRTTSLRALRTGGGGSGHQLMSQMSLASTDVTPSESR
ncbi:hypothetical protein R5R35_013775 [Gryllus longicercus]|uniref:Secreted protein n=1 Tax=Gryllus longicercus TaxID=2509291 RepID=A0AAN9W1T9_9ORTH